MVCVVDEACDNDVADARNKGVTLVAARNTLNDASVLEMFAKTSIETLASHQIRLDLNHMAGSRPH